VRQNGGGDLMAVVVEAGDEDTAPAADPQLSDDQPANDEEPPFDGEPEKKTFASQALVALDNQLRKAIITGLYVKERSSPPPRLAGRVVGSIRTGKAKKPHSPLAG
jgi:hypothetical protein